MTTTDCLIVFGPFLALATGMLIAFGVAHYNEVR
jgi:hypothetical protein